MVLATSILASSLAFVDGSVVNVGLPAIGNSLHAGAADLQWVINAYLLPLSALLLTAGALGDRLGRRRVLIFGVALFGIASVACTAAPDLVLLLAARVLQGIGAALLLPSSLAILGAAFDGEARGRAVGTWSAVSAIAGAIGPVLGGWLIDVAGWRAIFLINIPLAAAAIWLAIWFVPETAEGQGGKRLDTWGALLATASLAAMTWGLTVGSGREGWSISAAAFVVAGVVLLAIFLRVERERGGDAMMPLALFRSPDFTGLTLLTFLLYGALGALLVLLPYLLIEGDGYSGASAGAALLPFPIVVAFASRAMGGVAERLGARLPLAIGSLIVAFGFFLLLRVRPESGYWPDVLPAILTISIGMAAAVAPLTTAVLASVDARLEGTASGLNSAVARTGGLIATALLGTVLGSGGQQLFRSFHAAAIVCAVACIAAAGAAFALVGRRRS